MTERESTALRRQNRLLRKYLGITLDYIYLRSGQPPEELEKRNEVYRRGVKVYRMTGD